MFDDDPVGAGVDDEGGDPAAVPLRRRDDRHHEQQVGYHALVVYSFAAGQPRQVRALQDETKDSLPEEQLVQMRVVQRDGFGTPARAP